MGKKKKKPINVLTFFLFPIKVMSKLSLIRFLTSILRKLVSISLDENMKYSLSWLTFKTYVNAHTFPQKVIGRTTLKVFDENVKYSLNWLTFKTYVNAHTFPQKVIGRTTLKVFDETMQYSLSLLTSKTFMF